MLVYKGGEYMIAEKSIDTEYGMFYENKITKQTAEEVYQEWLENKDKQSDIPKTMEEKLGETNLLLAQIIISQL